MGVGIDGLPSHTLRARGDDGCDGLLREGRVPSYVNADVELPTLLGPQLVDVAVERLPVVFTVTVADGPGPGDQPWIQQA